MSPTAAIPKRARRVMMTSFNQRCVDEDANIDEMRDGIL
jgi:hypothetical protein